jgi:hypothetical protein
MRNAEKLVAVLIVALSTWALIMMAATNWQFKGNTRNRILLVEIGSDAASLTKAVQTGVTDDPNGKAGNVRLVVRNTYMDFLFIALYFLTYSGIAYLAGLLGQRLFASLAVICIGVAAAADLLENHAILIAMGLPKLTDPVAVDISEFSQVKWAFFFLATLLLGLAMALNRRTSNLRRMAGLIFVIAGACGILGIGRYRVSLDFAIVFINLGIVLVIVALLLLLWKLLQSVRELSHVEHVQQAHAHA